MADPGQTAGYERGSVPLGALLDAHLRPVLHVSPDGLRVWCEPEIIVSGMGGSLTYMFSGFLTELRHAIDRQLAQSDRDQP